METGDFAALWIAGFTAHQLFDHWVQSSEQAARKGLPGWPGRRACLAHVLTYTAGAAAFFLATMMIFSVPFSALGFTAALLLIAVSHYYADRRAPLKRLAARLGKETFWNLGVPRPGKDDNPSLGTGAYALDQVFHQAFLFLAVLLMVAL